MAQMLGLVVAVMVGVALAAVACYGCVTVVVTMLTVARPRQVDRLAEDLDAFLVELLGPRDPDLGAPGPDLGAPGRDLGAPGPDLGAPGPGPTPPRRRGG